MLLFFVVVVDPRNVVVLIDVVFLVVVDPKNLPFNVWLKLKILLTLSLQFAVHRITIATIRALLSQHLG